jgi:uncharacterized membrane protein
MISSKKILHWCRSNFLAGLVIILPVIISIGIIIWLFGTISGLTDFLLFFLPRELTHKDGGNGPVYWYWSLLSLIVAVLLTSAVGHFARYYIGKKFILMVESVMLKIPLLNKIYSTVKQINEALTSSKKSSFKKVVLVEFPRKGLYSIGFITGESNELAKELGEEKIVNVFIPTTPNPTTGFLIMVPEKELIKLDIDVQDGIKMIISLGSIMPENINNGNIKEVGLDKTK